MDPADSSRDAVTSQIVRAIPASLLAPAKLALSLRVVGVRDDAYHLIDAEMVSLDLADEIQLTHGSGVEVLGASGLAVPSGPRNLVSRALSAVGVSAHARILKRIPAGAGLGGASADAAAVLAWAGVADPRVALSLGADVAFCMRGGRARVTGVGEEIEQLPPTDRAFTLLTPPIGVSTALIYRTWDELGGPVGANVNDLEPAAVHAFPDLRAWRDGLCGTQRSRTPTRRKWWDMVCRWPLRRIGAGCENAACANVA